MGECPLVFAVSRVVGVMHARRRHTLDPIADHSVRYDSAAERVNVHHHVTYMHIHDESL